MLLSCSDIHVICEICMAIGGLATFATFVWVIKDSYRKSKQIETVQQIQSRQLESLYEPDMRIGSYGGIHNEIVINNHGENLIILGIYEFSDSAMLNNDGMKGWFPLHFDKGREIHIPLLVPPATIQSLCMTIECRNRLGLTYKSNIDINGGKPTISKAVIE